MGKPKKWVDPLKDREEAMKFKGFRQPKKPKEKPKEKPIITFGFDKGILTKIQEMPYQPGGYYEIPAEVVQKARQMGRYYYDESGEWNKEILGKLLETKPKIVKAPTDEFVDNWYQEHKDGR